MDPRRKTSADLRWIRLFGQCGRCAPVCSPLARNCALPNHSHLRFVACELQRKLETEASRIRKAKVAVVDKLIVGSPHRELGAIAERISADLVVVASAQKETTTR